MIIEAVHFSNVAGRGYAYFAVTAGVFITAFYSFRMLFLAFHGDERFAADPHHNDGEHHGLPPGEKPKESPWVVTVPLILLAIPSLYAGWQYVEPLIIGGYYGDSIVVAASHPAMAQLREEWRGIMKVVETDLGEYILQINNYEPPSHIIGPALHKSKEEVADLFHKAHG